ncbi:NUDIX hydrolase [Rossellomorea sp. AcN35-11]|nr:NUDIX hydrolase [Rossellomorea aquimaris]WJV31451.1 NUDIX hydrolase [Rossellomorea sp. AcN35-11]
MNERNTSKYHRAFGVYGVCFENDKLLVIRKNRGPYMNRYDLPGGSLEEGESLSQALKREYLEETGLDVELEENIGAVDFKLPWKWREYTDVHHIAVYYSVRFIAGEISVPEPFEAQDSLGAVWVTEEEVSIDNASPLVLKAFQWIRTKTLGVEAESYEHWTIVK